MLKLWFYQLSVSIFGLKILYNTILLLLLLLHLSLIRTHHNSSSLIANENACSPHSLRQMWIYFEPPLLPLSNENNRGSYHNSLPLRMEEVSTHTILHASCGIGAEQSLLLLLLRMGNGCWCDPIVLTEHWELMQNADWDKFISIATAVSCRYNCHLHIMIIQSQLLSFSPQPQVSLVSTWSWELVRGGGMRQEASATEKNSGGVMMLLGLHLVLLVCCYVLYYDISWWYYGWCKITSWPQIYTLKLKQDCC